jgi:hypothetical protein
MVQLQRNKRRSDRRLPKKNWKSIDKTVYGYVKRTEDKIIEKQRSEEKKKRKKYFRLLEKVQKIREKSSLPEKWNSSELTTMIQWYRRKGDSKIPTTVAERRQRYFDVCGCGDPHVPEVVADDDHDLAAAVAGNHEITATAAAGDLEIAVADDGDNIVASDDESTGSDALVLRHEV